MKAARRATAAKPSASRTGAPGTRTTPLITIREGGWSLSGVFIVRHRHKFGLVAYAGMDPATGRERPRKWLGTYSTRRDAEAARAAYAHHPLFAAGPGPYGSPQLRTREYLVSWHQERAALGRIRPRTAQRYEELMRLHVFPLLGHVPLARIAPMAIQQVCNTMVTDRGLSTTTARQVHAILRKALRDATRQGLIARNPCDNTTPPPVADYEPSVFTPEQAAAYLEDARQTATPAVYALYMTAATCGLRLGELLGVPDTAADLAHRPPLLHVQQQLVRAGRTPVYGQPKTKRGRRVVVLPHVAVEAIRRALVWKKEQRLKLGPGYHDAGLLFCGPRGRPLNPSNLRNRDHLPRLRRLGLPHSRIHDLRHFHGTMLAAAHVDARTISDRLGHSRVGFTLDTYVHPALEAQERAAAAANDGLTKLGLSGG